MTENDLIFGHITPKQETFIEAYLDEDFTASAASEAGISERTARRWLASPLVQAAIAHVRETRRKRREDRLAVCIDRAINILFDNLLCCEDEKEAERTQNYIPRDLEFKYVALMLKYVCDSREVEALRARVAELEAGASAPIVEGSAEKAVRIGQNLPCFEASTDTDSTQIRHLKKG